MSTTTEREIKVADGLGNADASQVLAGVTFSSENGFNQQGTFAPDASNITYNDGTVADALDDLVENGVKNGTELTDILPSGQTTITFTSEEITNDSKLNAVYTSIFDVPLESATFGEGSLTLVFPAQEEDMTVTVLINATSTGDNIVAREVMDDLNAHIGDTDNPHNVVASQIGIDNSVSGMNANDVQGAIDEVNRTLGYTKSYNLLPCNKVGGSWNGITTTPVLNNDNSVAYYSVSGSRTSETYYVIYNSDKFPKGVEAGKTYKVSANSTNALIKIQIYEFVGTNATMRVLTDTVQEWTPSANITKIEVRIAVDSEASGLDDVRIYPMIIPTDIEDSAYMPYVTDLDTRLEHYDYLDIKDKLTVNTSNCNVSSAFIKNGNVYINGTVFGTSTGIINLFTMNDANFMPIFSPSANVFSYNNVADLPKIANIVLTKENRQCTAWVTTTLSNAVNWYLSYPLI